MNRDANDTIELLDVPIGNPEEVTPDNCKVLAFVDRLRGICNRDGKTIPMLGNECQEISCPFCERK